MKKNNRHRIIDISVLLCKSLPVWPGTQRFKRVFDKQIKHGDDCNSSILTLHSHAGTHIDSPIHFLKGTKGADKLDLSKLIGPAYVLDLSQEKDMSLEGLKKKWKSRWPERILLKTENSLKWKDPKFFKPYIALVKEIAEFLVKKEVRLIGVDYLSIQNFRDTPEVHHILLKKEIVILEGLDLSHVKEGLYFLICLPLKIKDGDGAPCRAVLIEGDLV